MTILSFLHRQNERVKYYFSTHPTSKRIAEINRYKKIVVDKNNCYTILPLDLRIPKVKFDFIFGVGSFEYLIGNAKNLNGRYDIVDDRLLFSFEDLQIIITSCSELFIINEIFVNKCYNFITLRDRKIVIIDIGMNVGLASLFFAGIGNVEGIYGFEPFEPSFLLAQKNFEINSLRTNKIKAYNFGLGETSGEFAVAYDSTNRGINKSLVDNGVEGVQEMVHICIKPTHDTIDALLRAHPDCDFVLKIDTEGAEYSIFKSLFKNPLSKQVVGFMVEWHMEGPEELENQLLANNFTILSLGLTSVTGLVYAFR